MTTWTVAKLAQQVGGEVRGDGAKEIFRVADFENAGQGDIAFVEKSGSLSVASAITASCLIIPENFASEFPCATISAKNPKLTFAKIAALLHPAKKRAPEIHASAVIASSAKIGNEVFIGAFVYVGENSTVGSGTQIRAGAKIGDGVSVGENCVIYPNVFLEDGVVIGNRVVLHTGVVIGADGFGYVRDEHNYVKFPQIGTVVIEDDVEIGANSCIDRGALGETRIGNGTKIDNLVQIAHNVRIGARVVIAAQTGISGSTIIEDDCVIGGQVGFGDHAKVLSGAVIGSQAGILPGKIVRAGVWWGTPVQPLEDFKKLNAHVKSLPRLKEEIGKLKQEIQSLKKQDG